MYATHSQIQYVLLCEDILLENRLQYLKDNTRPFDISHDTTAKHQDHSAIIDHFANNADPSKNKQYTQYVLGLYKSKAIRQEDTDRVKDAITNFDRYKHKLAPEKKQLTVKNYPTTASIHDAIKPYVGTAVTKAEKREEVKQNLDIPGKHELKYEDDNIKIFHLKDKDTSKKLYCSTNDKNPGAHPTEWCTARDTENNMFDQYHKDGPLHVIHRKSDGAVFQYHAESNQFMNKEDNSISDDDFMSIHKSLHKAWRENPELTK